MGQTMRARQRVKRLAVLAHLWLGLTIGAVWALQGLTGALLVFHRDIDRAEFATASGTTRSLDELVAVARGAMNGTPEAIGLYYPDPSILGVTFTDERRGKRTVLVDSVSGTVLGIRDRTPSSPVEGNLWRWIYNLHHSLLMGERGEWLLGASGLLLLSMAGSGAWLGWPRRGQWRAAYEVRRWRSRVQKLFGWHRAIGLAAALAIAVLAASGGMMDFAKPLRTWAAVHAGYRMPYKPGSALPPHRVIGPAHAYAAAIGQFPDAQLTSVSLPTPQSPTYQVRLRRLGEWRTWSGTTIVTIDAASGRILSTYDAITGPFANQILDAAFPVHSGEVGGLPGRILVFLAGLSLPILYITGLLAWLRRRRARRMGQGREDARPTQPG